MFVYVKNINGDEFIINTDYLVMIINSHDYPNLGKEGIIYTLLMSNDDKILIDKEQYDFFIKQME